jgi:hypothetical protein
MTRHPCLRFFQRRVRPLSAFATILIPGRTITDTNQNLIRNAYARDVPVTERQTAVGPIGPAGRSRPVRPVNAAASALAVILAAPAGLLAGFGWLYALRGLGWLAVGPRVGDSLPLLQLAGFDGQPLLRVVIAWLPAGAVAGLALVRVSPLRRAVLLGTLGLIVLLFASQASYALARNLRLSSVLSDRTPGLGAWLEGGLFAAGSVLGSVARLGRPLARRQARRSRGQGIGSRLAGIRDLRLGDRQHRDASEHHRDRDQVQDDGRRAAS